MLQHPETKNTFILTNKKLSESPINREMGVPTMHKSDINVLIQNVNTTE